MTEHIKVYGVKPRIQYTANGTLNTYSFPFAIFKDADLCVYLNETKQDASAYFITGARSSDGGTVTFVTAPTAGTVITITRDLSIERTSDFQEGGSLRADTLNNELDYQIACQQQIADSLNRSMVLPPYAADSDVNLTLPMPAAGKAIVWNANGTNLENSTVEVNALENTLREYKEDAESAASVAEDKAEIATTQAEISTTQAGIATTKANEAASSANQLNGMRTNCITQIPQDIKLELNNGTLTLKTGSIIYVPNGANTFDRTTLSQDATAPFVSTGTDLVFRAGNQLLTMPTNLCFSGDTPPSGNTYMMWYDTTNNKIKYTADGGTTWQPGYNIPVGKVTKTAGGDITIDQIFNGFSYINSVIFALPGTKGFVPNGRDADGILKNTSFELNNVLTHTISGTFVNKTLLVNETGLSTDNNTYNPTNNQNSNALYCVAGSISASNGKITSFESKTSFCALDYNDKGMIIDWEMPDYSAGISVASNAFPYTAPSNGYIDIAVQAQNGTEYVSINNTHVSAATSTNGTYYSMISGQYKVAAGDIISVSTAANVQFCTFFPMKGV